MSTPETAPHGREGAQRNDDDERATPDVAHVANEDVAHEGRDVNVRAIIKFGVGMTVGVAVVMALMYGAFQLMNAGPRSDPSRPMSRLARTGDDRLPPHPRLQNAPGQVFQPRDFTEDPILQKELSAEDLSFENDSPEHYWQILRGTKMKELATYGAIERNPQEFRIPVDEAKQRLIDNNSLAARGEESEDVATAAAQSQSPAAMAEELGGKSHTLRPTAASAGRDYEKAYR